MADRILGDNVVDLNTARAARDALREREAAARRARPFQGRLLKAAAAGMRPGDLAAIREAIATGFVNGDTTQDIVRSIRRDEVRAKARAAL